MKSCLGILLVFSTFVAVIGGGAFLYYLSCTAEFSRKSASAETAPKASIVIPKEIPKARRIH
jgi:hypothetical protein